MRRLLPEPGDIDDDELVAAYRLPPGRHLRVNFIASLDGVIAIQGLSGGLGTPGDRRVFRVLRALADCVLVGFGTAAAEGYGPVAPDSSVGRLRAALGRPPAEPIAVVSRRASLTPDDKLLGGPTILVTCEVADAGRRDALAGAGVDVLVCGDEDVNLRLALDLLAERGLEQIVCEGGPSLFRTALEAAVVDELDLSIAPALVGGDQRLLSPVGLLELVRPRLHQVLEEDGVLFTRYAVRPAGTPAPT
jgi:riboflavin biosynthesis pyrimidine reductase